VKGDMGAEAREERGWIRRDRKRDSQGGRKLEKYGKLCNVDRRPQLTLSNILQSK